MRRRFALGRLLLRPFRALKRSIGNLMSRGSEAAQPRVAMPEP